MKLFYFFSVIALVTGLSPVDAQTTNAAPINTVPEGITSFNLPATPAGVIETSYFSAPLVNDPMYTGAVSAVTANTVSVADTPAPWTPGTFGDPAAPYFLKFLSGNEVGRVLLVQSNTTNTLTLDTSDNTVQSVALNTTGFDVQAGDTFEVFAGDTLGLMFGLNTTKSPLVLKGGNIITADTVSLFSSSSNTFKIYYFDTTAGFWKQTGQTTSANNTIIYPYSGFLITRRANEPATSFVLTGRVAEVNHLIKTIGNNSIIFNSTGYPVDMTLSQLKLGSNWAKATIPTSGLPSPVFADTISVWNPSANQFDSYFELTDSTWRKAGGGATDQSSFTIPAGTTVSILKRSSVSGVTSYLQTSLPYSLNADN